MSKSAKPNSPQEAAFNARRGRPQAAGEPVLVHASAAFARAGFSDASLVLRWSEIAGEEIARIAQPLKLQEGPDGAVLTLKCDPGASVFLQHVTRSLVERVNAYLGHNQVARIRLMPGLAERVLEPPPHPLRSAPRAAQPDDLELTAAVEGLARLRTQLRRQTR